MRLRPAVSVMGPSSCVAHQQEALAHVDAVVAITDGAVDLAQQLGVLVDGVDERIDDDPAP